MPETVIYLNRLYQKRAIISSEIFRGIPPLETANKLDAILLHLSIYYSYFKNIEQFLDRLPAAGRYEFAVEFRYPSLSTEP